MLKRTALAILAPLVLAACDPEVRAVEQDFVVEETVTTQTTPYFQQQVRRNYKEQVLCVPLHQQTALTDL